MVRPGSGRKTVVVEKKVKEVVVVSVLWAASIVPLRLGYAFYNDF